LFVSPAGFEPTTFLSGGQSSTFLTNCYYWYKINNAYGAYEKGNHLIVKDLLEEIRKEMEPLENYDRNPDEIQTVDFELTTIL
jgi:hypothetical protein